MKRAWLITEFLLLYFVSPLLVYHGLLPKWPIPVLVFTSSIMFWFLWRDPNFKRRWLTNPRGAKVGLRLVIWRFIPIAIAGVLFIYFVTPELNYAFLMQSKMLFFAIIVAYPLLSVYPQEIIYRAFLFYRYKPLFGKKYAMIFASAAAFGWVHIVFGHWLSVFLSFLAGLVFAHTYARSRSLVLVFFEHSLYGVYIFSVGLGAYFYAAAH